MRTVEITVSRKALTNKRIYLRYQVIGDADVLVGAEVSAVKTKAELSIDAGSFFEALGDSQVSSIFNRRDTATLTINELGKVESVA